jgi:acetyltransferase-like isoleucine patch superfamily enzyme
MSIVSENQDIAKSAKIDPDVDIRASWIIIGENVIIGKGFRAIVSGTLEIGYASVTKNTQIYCKNIKIGSNNYIDGVLIEGSLNSMKKNVSIGNENLILQNTRINCNDEVKIGNDVGIGQYVDIWTHGSFMDVIAGYPYSIGPVSIGNHVWITAHSTIMPNTKIGDNVIIGNNTVVNKDVPAGCFFAGMPGKVIKENVFPPKISQEQQEKTLDKIIVDYLETCISKGFLPRIHRTGLNIQYSSPRGNDVVFYTKERKIDGNVDIFSEDFRDYLRFRCVKFFTDIPFKPITPLDFQKLQGLE